MTAIIVEHLKLWLQIYRNAVKQHISHRYIKEK